MKLTGIAPGFRTTHVKEFFPGISCKLSPCSDHISYAIPHLVFFPYKIVDGNGGTTSSTIRNNIVDVCALLVQCRICTKGQQSAFRFLDTRVVVWVLPLCYHECKSFQTLLLCCAASSRCVFDAKWPRFVPGPPFTCPQLLLACKCIHVVSLLWFVLVQLILIQKNSVLYPCSSDNLCWTAFFRFIISLLNALRSFA